MTQATRHALSLGLAALLVGCALGRPELQEAAPVREAQPAEAATHKARETLLTVDDVLAKMEAARKTLKTLTASVVKKRTVVPLDDTEYFDGVLVFKMPRLLFLKLTSRQNKRTTRIIVGPDYAWIHRVEDQQAEGVILKNLDKKKKADNPLQYGLSENVFAFKKAYELTLKPETTVNGEPVVVLEMLPRVEERYTEEGKVTLWLSKQTWLAVQVEEVRNDGDVIETHTFKDMKVNVDVDEALFEWEPGPDLEVRIMQPE
jgi:outer membrane lipoprotein-sorting protein